MFNANKSVFDRSTSLLFAPARRLWRAAGAARRADAGHFEALEPRAMLSFNWTGLGDGTSWNDPANWNQSGAEGVPSGGDDAVIAIDATVNLQGSSVSVGSLTVNPFSFLSLINGGINVDHSVDWLSTSASGELDADLIVGENFTYQSGGTLALGANVQANTISITGAVVLTAPATLTSTGTVTVDGPIDSFSEENLSITGGFVSLGDVGVSGALGSLVIDSFATAVGAVVTNGPVSLGSQATLTGEISTTANGAGPGGAVLAGSLIVAGDVRIDSGSANITITGNIDADSEADAWTLGLVSSGTTTITGEVGSGQRLGAFYTDSYAGGLAGFGGTLQVKNISVLGNIGLGDSQAELEGVYSGSAGFAAAGDVILQGVTTLNFTGGNVEFFGTIDSPGGPFALSAVNADAVRFHAAIGTSSPLLNVTATAEVVSAASIRVVGAITLTGNSAVFLRGTIAGLGGGTVSVLGFITLEGGTLIDAGSGLLTLQGGADGAATLELLSSNVITVVGSFGVLGAPLASFVTSGGGTTVRIAGGIRADTVEINSGIELTGSGELSTSGPGPIRVVGPIDGAGHELKLTGPGPTELLGSVGGVSAIVGQRTGLTRIAGNQTSTGSITYAGPVLLADDIVFDANGGAITFDGPIDSDSEFDPRNLTLNSSGSTRLNAPIGASVRLGGVTTDFPGSFAAAGIAATGNIDLGGSVLELSGSYDTTGGSFTADGAVVLTDTTFVAAAAGSVTFTSAVDGPGGLIVNSPSTTVFAGVVGTGVRVGFLFTDAAGSLEIGTAQTVGQLSLSDANIALGGNLDSTNSVLVEGDVTLLNDAVVQAPGGVSMSGSIDGTRALSIFSAGTVTLSRPVGPSVPLASLVVAAPNAVLGASVTTFGPQSYNGAVTFHGAEYIALGGPISVILQAQAGSIVFAAAGDTTLSASDITLDGPTAADPGNTLRLLAAGLSTVRNNPGGSLGSLVSDAPGTLSFENAGVTLAGVAALDDASVVLDHAVITVQGGPASVPGTVSFSGGTDVGFVVPNGLLTLGPAVGSAASAQLLLDVRGLDLLGPITGGQVRIVNAGPGFSTRLGVDGDAGELSLSAAEIANLMTFRVIIDRGTLGGPIVVESAVEFSTSAQLLAVTGQVNLPGQVVVNAPVRVLNGNTLTITAEQITLAADLTTAGANLLLDGAVLIGNADVRLDSSGGGTAGGPGDVIVTGTIDAAVPGSGALAVTGGVGRVRLLAAVGATTAVDTFSATGNVVEVNSVYAINGLFLGSLSRVETTGTFEAIGGGAVTVTGLELALAGDTRFVTAGGSITLTDVLGNQPGLNGPHALVLDGTGVTTLNLVAGVSALINYRAGDTTLVNNLFTDNGPIIFTGRVVSGSDGSYQFDSGTGPMAFTGGFTWGDESLTLSGQGDTLIGGDSTFGTLAVGRTGSLVIGGSLAAVAFVNLVSPTITFTAPNISIVSTLGGLIGLQGNVSTSADTALFVNTSGLFLFSGSTLALASLEVGVPGGAGDFQVSDPAVNLNLTGPSGLVINATGSKQFRGRTTTAEGAPIFVAGGGATYLEGGFGSTDLLSGGEMQIDGDLWVVNTAAQLRSKGGPGLAANIFGAGDLLLAPANGTQTVLVGAVVPPDGVYAVSTGLLGRVHLDPGSGLTIGSQDQSGSIVFDGAVTLPAIDVTFLVPVAPGQIIINTAPTVPAGGSLRFIGSGQTLVLNDALITDGVAIEIDDSVIIGPGGGLIDTTNGGLSGGASVTINGTVNAATPGIGLAVAAGAGVVTFNGVVGGVVALDSLLVSPAAAVVIGGNVTTVFNQVYLAPVAVTGSFTLTATGFQADVIFGSTLTLASGSVFTVVASEADFAGLVSGDNAQLNIFPFNITQNISVAGAEATLDLEITQSELTNFGGVAGVQIGTLPGTASLNVGDATIFTTTTFAMAGTGGSVNIRTIRPGTANTGVVIRGSEATTEITGSITTRGGFVSIFDAVRLAGPTVLIDTTDSGVDPGAPVFIAFAINSAPAQTNSLVIDAGDSTVGLDGSVGLKPDGQLGSLEVNAAGGIDLASPVLRTEDEQSYNGPVELGADVVIQTTQADVTFNGDVSGVQNLTIAPNTGSTVFTGTVGTLNTLVIGAGNSRRFEDSVAVLNLQVDGGTLVFEGATEITDAQMSGGEISGAGDITITGLFVWTGGAIHGPGGLTIASTGTLRADGAATKTLGRDVSASGAVEWLAGDLAVTSGLFNNLGTLRLASGGTLSSGVGTQLVNSGAIRAASATVATLTGFAFLNTGEIAVESGTLALTDATGVFTNNGTLSVAAFGRFRVVGGFTNTGAATVRVEIGLGESDADRPDTDAALVVTGEASLAGTLSVSFAGGQPELFDAYLIVDAAARTGSFGTLTLVGTPPTFVLVELPDGPALSVLVTADTDFDHNGQLNLDDLNDYMTFFYDAAPGDRDFNGDGYVNLDDLGDFITLFYWTLSQQPQAPVAS